MVTVREVMDLLMTLPPGSELRTSEDDECPLTAISLYNVKDTSLTTKNFAASTRKTKKPAVEPDPIYAITFEMEY
jgi:hypothetical protein